MNNKILGIIGSALLIIGLFLPVVSIAGFISFSAFNAITSAPINQSWGAILLGLCGIIGLVLALTNRFRMLLVPGIISLGIIVLAFVKIKSELSSAADTAGGDEFSQQMAASVSIGFGIYVMAIGAIIMIVAGIMKSAAPAVNPGWGAPPPPPYPPAR